MKTSAKFMNLRVRDEYFSDTYDQQEHVMELPLSDLHPFKGHPFRVVDDEDMEKTVESIREYGVLTPAIVRPDPDGGYEIISGHRRHHASKLAGKKTLPVIVRNMDNDAATILMVDSNLQRETILPSERAFAYKMKLEAMKRQGERKDLTSAQVGQKFEGKTSRDILAEQVGQSKNQISRYIRLTELLPELLDMVDAEQIKFIPAVDISYLTKDEQKELLEILQSADGINISTEMAKAMKDLSKEGNLDREAMLLILGLKKQKKVPAEKPTVYSDMLRDDRILGLLPKKMQKKPKQAQKRLEAALLHELQTNRDSAIEYFAAILEKYNESEQN